MQQPSATAIPYFTYAPGIFNQEGGGASGPWHDSSKANQYPSHQWDNNGGGFHVTAAGQYGTGQVPTGGGQNRVPGPPQQQTPQQPPPTSTPPGGIHDMSKQPLMQTQTGQLGYVAARLPNPNFPYQRGGGMGQQQALRHNRAQMATPLYNSLPVLTQTPGQTLTQVVQYQPLMYGAGVQTRQNAPYASQGQYAIMQQSYPYATSSPTPGFYAGMALPPYQGIASGGPSPQAGGQVIRTAMVTNPTMPPPATKQEPKKRAHAIKIINPENGAEVVLEENNSGVGNNNDITPTGSNDSSARETPQPISGVAMENTVATEFLTRVAAAAGEPTTPAQPPSEQPGPPELITSPSDLSDHKQSSAVISDKTYPLSVLSTASEEFVPRSLKQLPVEPTPPPMAEHVPTVSAETNSPAIEIQRSKEFPALKNPPATQSPARTNVKKKSENNFVAPQPPPTEKETAKKGVKGGQKEESTPLPKERREKTRSASKEQSPAASPALVMEITSSQSDSSVTPKTVPLVPSKETVKNNSLSHTAVEEPSNNKGSQQQNGETAFSETVPSTVDGSKTSRPKNKKNNKMRELNRKGVEKEGSDMDAFTETAIVNEEKERPETPATPPPVTPIPATVEPTPTHENKIKDDLEEKEDRVDKLVAAKNEENTKVSALPQEDNKVEAPVIEKVVEEKKQPPQLTLRHSYKRDQWSPLNPDGKKKYERDFLMELKMEPQSNVKPDNLPDVVAVIRDSSNNMRNNNQGMNFMNNRSSNLMMPEFLRGSQSQRGPLPKGRGSQQGKKPQNPKVIHMSLSLQEDVKLRTAENAWKPTRLESDAEKSEDQKDVEKLYKEVRGILNKLTPQKFDTLMKKFLQLPINSEERLIGVIGLIFDKAVDEPNFSKAYANMCKLCSKMEVSKMENGQEQKVNFRKILITRCQTEFEKNKSSELDAAKRFEEIKNCTDPEQKKELQLAYEEKERTIRRKSVGNIRFIGELFKLGMLTPAIMYRCIEHLLSTVEEESLECLCKLLTTIGKDLELGSQQQKTSLTLNPYFQKMSELAQKREGSKVSSRVRFMLQDVIELRQNKWVPRREDNNPKTIEQITKEAEQESIAISMNLQQPPRMNRQNDRPDDRKRGNRGNNQSDGDGWVTQSSRYSHKFTPAFEASKMQNIVKNEISDLNSLSLGGRSQFIFNQTTKSMETKTPSFTSNNVFSALSEKKPPTQPNNRRLTPTPSIEKDKERQRMIQGAFESEGRNSRGSSVQRERQILPSSQPPSRESSIPRQPDNKDTERRSDKRPEDKVDEASRRATEERLERQTQTIFDEFLAGLSTIEDVKQDVEQGFQPDQLGSFVCRGLELSLEKKAGAQKQIGQLIETLMDYNVVSTKVFVEQLSVIYENAEDIAIDVPKAYELQAQVIVPILAAEKINFSHIKAACSSVLQTDSARKLLIPILRHLAEEKGAGFARKIWDASNVSLKDFLPPDVNIDAFIKDNSLEYLTGEPPQYEPISRQSLDSSNLSMDEVQDQLTRLMQSNTPCDKIFQFISSNVGDKVESLQFIRALITAICTACITGSSYNIDTARFKEYEKLIQRYVDNKEDREVACLSSVHNVSSQLEHPQGLILSIFDMFLEKNLISCESFFKWKNDHTEKLENKGVTLYALTSFFKALGEAESDDENS